MFRMKNIPQIYNIKSTPIEPCVVSYADNVAHGTGKLLLKTQVSEDFG